MSSFIDEDLCTLDFTDHFLRKAVGKTHEIPAESILQIQQISNISLPKQDTKQNYEPEKQVLKITVTDGETSVFAVVLEAVPRININTPPGTKIKISQTTPLVGQIFLLTKNNHQVIGGNVTRMVEKWNFQRKMDVKQEWGSFGRMDGPEGPPLWRPLGQKTIPLDISALRKMKAMDIVNEKNENSKEGEETQTQFDVQRNEAISELMEKSVKQKWQKPNKHLLDKELLDIMDEGFSMEEASDALRKFKNPQKALKFLKGRFGDYDSASTSAPLPEERKERKSKRNSKMGDIDEDDAPIPKEYQRPTRNISLFGFIADHIKVDETDDTAAQKTTNDITNSVHRMDFRDNDRYDDGARGRGRGYGRSANPRHRGSNFPPSRGRNHYEQDDRAERSQSAYIKPSQSYNPPDQSSFHNRNSSRGRGFGRQDYPQGRGQDYRQDGYQETRDRGMSGLRTVPPRGNSSFRGFREPNTQPSFSQPPRFQKQFEEQDQYPPIGSSMPNKAGPFGQRNSDYSSSSHPTNEKYKARVSDKYDKDNSRKFYDGYNNRGPSQPPSHHVSQHQQYGIQDGWQPNQTMVFTRSKSENGPERGRGGQSYQPRY